MDPASRPAPAGDGSRRAQAPAASIPADLLDTALQRLYAVDACERSAAAEALAAEHPHHAEGIRQLLAQLGATERLLAAQFPGCARDDAPPVIGGYRVERQLGEGAFGTVYLCTQKHPVVRPVAVKVLRPGAGDQHTLRRFEAERQVLASLQHPAITHVYDAGRLADGRPYFVMEYVDGLPITRFCLSRNLDCAARLRLFVQVCRGVEYAHGRGVVHRDLKPSNLLVIDGTGEPLAKIIDFGIAKALAPGGAIGGEAATDAGRVLGTPGYMSPEQAAARLELIDERSDVFALGVVLYELLTGELPWPRGEGMGEVTPMLPSRRLGSSSSGAPGAPEAGRSDARLLATRVRGDLDWITRKATHVDRAERYADVSALADDLERHLAGRPVLAGPASIAYRLRKLVQRNRAATWALAVAVTAAAGLVIAAWQGRTANAEVRRAAEAIATSSAEAAAAVQKLLEHAKDPSLLSKPQSESIRQGLAADALRFYDQWLATRPQDAALRLQRCEALLTLAEVHNVLGQHEEASRRAEQAAGDAQELVDATPEGSAERALLAEALRKRHRALLLLGHAEEAYPFIADCVRHYERLAARDPAGYGVAFGRSLSDLATVATLRNRPAEAEAAVTRSIATLEDLLQRGIATELAQSDLVRARFALAMVQTKAGNYDEAERSLAAVEAGLDALTEGRLRVTTGVYRQQGVLKLQRGDHAGALPLLQRAIAAAETWRRQEPQQAMASALLHSCLQDLAATQDKLGDFVAGEQTMRRIVEVGEERLAALPAGASFAAEQARALFWFARKLWNRLRYQDLTLAKTWIARARVLAAETAEPPPWAVEATQALIADAAGDADDRRWERVAAALPATPAQTKAEWIELVAEAWLATARARWRSGDPTGAAAALADVEPFLEWEGKPRRYTNNYLSELSWWRARLCLGAGDVASAASHVERLLERRPGWWGQWRAGDCEREAWRRTAEAGDESAAAHRDAAALHYRAAIAGLGELVAKDADDPWPVVPWGFAHLGLAETEADRGEHGSALALLDAGLTALGRVEASAHRDVWDARGVEAARALRERLSQR